LISPRPITSGPTKSSRATPRTTSSRPASPCSTWRNSRTMGGSPSRP
jgi:hypothetical protein